MKTYKHLNKEERRILAVLLQRKESLRTIAKTLKRSHSTISRELRRNLTQQRYNPLHSEFISRVRHRACHRRERLRNPALKKQVRDLLKHHWSPEIIAGRLATLFGYSVVSHEAIYQWVYADSRNLIRFLPRHNRIRGIRRIDRSKSLILGRIPVTERSPQANRREEHGHWEVDLVIGGGRSALQVAVERKTRFSRLAKVHDKSANASCRALHRTFSTIPESFHKSITYDNGLENALHREINQSFGLQSYFCFPHHPWEKPSVENTNGLIRWFLPKRTNLDIISHRKIAEIEAWLNSRPRKCLNYKTPQEALDLASGALTG